MKKKNTKTELANLKSSMKVKDKLKKYCKANGLKIKDCVENIILKFLEENKQ